MDRATRRELLKASALGLFSASLSGLPERLACAATANKSRSKSVIVLWTDGGMPQQDTFDMKPDAPEHIRGVYKPISTAVPGIQICEKLPKIAAQMKQWSVIRSLYSSEAPSHPIGGYKLHTEGIAEGFRGKPTALGAALSACLASPDLPLPPHLVLGAEPHANIGVDPFPARFAQTILRDGSIDGLRAMATPAVDQTAFDKRFALQQQLSGEFRTLHADDMVKKQQAVYDRAIDLMRSPILRDLNVEQVPAQQREKFGDNRVGRGLLLASMLVEAGVPFVEVKWTHDLRLRMGVKDNVLKAWDTHENNFATMDDYLPILDAGLSSLVERLQERGLLESTLIVVMGEMGRTPKVNKKAGRDHFGRAWSVAFAGAGIRGGVMHGNSTPDGDTVQDGLVKVPDLMATICLAVGVDPATEFHPRTGERLDPAITAQAMTPGKVRLVAAAAKPVKEILL